MYSMGQRFTAADKWLMNSPSDMTEFFDHTTK